MPCQSDHYKTASDNCIIKQEPNQMNWTSLWLRRLTEARGVKTEPLQIFSREFCCLPLYCDGTMTMILDAQVPVASISTDTGPLLIKHMPIPRNRYHLCMYMYDSLIKCVCVLP